MSQTIKRNYLHDTAAARLRAMISKGEIKPGERLQEGALAEAFGVSRTPLREAIKILATENLLEILPNQGPRVRLIDEVELKNMLQVIAVLEATAGEQACRLISERETERLQGIHDAMLSARETNDTRAYFDLNRQIHDAIVTASENETLERIYQSLSGRIQVARYSANKTPAQWEKAVGEHERMMACLRARDGETMFSILREHVLSQQSVILAAYGIGSRDGS